jgi:hypothetical protein
MVKTNNNSMLASGYSVVETVFAVGTSFVAGALFA